jgi:hypothetical protein
LEIGFRKKKRLHFSRALGAPHKNKKYTKQNKANYLTFFHHGKTISKQKLLEKQKKNPQQQQQQTKIIRY